MSAPVVSLGWCRACRAETWHERHAVPPDPTVPDDHWKMSAWECRPCLGIPDFDPTHHASPQEAHYDGRCSDHLRSVPSSDRE